LPPPSALQRWPFFAAAIRQCGRREVLTSESYSRSRDRKGVVARVQDQPLPCEPPTAFTAASPPDNTLISSLIPFTAKIIYFLLITKLVTTCAGPVLRAHLPESSRGTPHAKRSGQRRCCCCRARYQ
jgi:hypothetical protein